MLGQYHDPWGPYTMNQHGNPVIREGGAELKHPCSEGRRPSHAIRKKWPCPVALSSPSSTERHNLSRGRNRTLWFFSINYGSVYYAKYGLRSGPDLLGFQQRTRPEVAKLGSLGPWGPKRKLEEGNLQISAGLQLLGRKEERSPLSWMKQGMVGLGRMPLQNQEESVRRQAHHFAYLQLNSEHLLHCPCCQQGHYLGRGVCHTI